MNSAPKPAPREEPHCALCGAPIPPHAPFGQCPKCLLSLGSGAGMFAVVDEGMLDAMQVRRVGDFELQEELARGGMGVVYRARQLSLNRPVAVKMILAGQLATTESVRRFRNEAAAAAKLDHPNIVPVYEVGECETQHYFAMRLVTGGRNVATWAKSLDLPPGKRAQAVAAMMAKIARAVAFAHERGVLHRDLKPSNILVDEKGEPQVTDFGLAKLVQEEDSSLTLSAMMLGSPSYMAPEQADGRHREVTTATDVYGLGAVLYELLAGRPPFLAASPLATAKRVVEEAPAPLPAAPRDLSTVCLKCLAKVPAQRYASALAVAEDLERFARGELIRARPVTGPEALWRWARRRPKIAALLGVLVLAFLLGFAGVTWQWRRAERARAAQEVALEHLQWAEIGRWVEGDEAPPALAYLASLLRDDPHRWQAAMYAMSIVERRPFPILAGPSVEFPSAPAVPAQITPDGQRFVDVGKDRVARVFDVASGQEIAALNLTSDPSAMSIAPDGKSAVLGTADGAVQMWPFSGTEVRRLLRSQTQPVQAFDFSADGATLAAASAGDIELWNPGDATAAPRLVAKGDANRGLALSDDGQRLFAFGSKEAVVWDAATGQRVRTLAAQERFRAGIMHRSGDRLALVDGNFRAEVWDVATGQSLQTFASELSPIIFGEFNTTGERLTLAYRGSDLGVYDIARGVRISPPMRHLYQSNALVVSADGSRSATSSWDGRVIVWNSTDGGMVMEPVMQHDRETPSMDLCRDGSRILLSQRARNAQPRKLEVWHPTSGRAPRLHPVPGHRDFNGCRLSPDGRLGCLGLWDKNRAYLYEIETDRVVLDRPVAGDIHTHLFSPDMQRYYALTANGWVYGWSLVTGEALWEANHQPGAIRPAAISPDGSRIIAGHNDGHIRVYDTATGLVEQTLEHSGEIKVLRFAPDRSGRFLSGSTDTLVHVWDLNSGKILTTLRGHTGTVLTAAFSPDCRRIATGSYDWTARLWDAATGAPLPTPPMTHRGDLSHLGFHPSGRLLATASRDGTARLWDTGTGEPVSEPLGNRTTVFGVRFTPDRHCLLVRDHSGFQFYEVATGRPVTIHHPFPISAGMGWDDDASHSMLSADGTRVFLGNSANAGGSWTISIPRGPAPAWFPDLLETLALSRLDAAGQVRYHPGNGIFTLREKIAALPAGDFYGTWARTVLGGK
jgi:WD40 repeat protein